MEQTTSPLPLPTPQLPADEIRDWVERSRLNELLDEVEALYLDNHTDRRAPHLNAVLIGLRGLLSG